MLRARACKISRNGERAKLLSPIFFSLWVKYMRHMIGAADMSVLIFSRLLGARSELSPHADLFAVTC